MAMPRSFLASCEENEQSLFYTRLHERDMSHKEIFIIAVERNAGNERWMFFIVSIKYNTQRNYNLHFDLRMKMQIYYPSK